MIGGDGFRVSGGIQCAASRWVFPRGTSMRVVAVLQ